MWRQIRSAEKGCCCCVLNWRRGKSGSAKFETMCSAASPFYLWSLDVDLLPFSCKGWQVANKFVLRYDVLIRQSTPLVSLKTVGKPLRLNVFSSSKSDYLWPYNSLQLDTCALLAEINISLVRFQHLVCVLQIGSFAEWLSVAKKDDA